jgi:peptide/nickel transport system ATP-binding protein
MAAPTDAPLLVADDLRADFTLPRTAVHAVRSLSYTVGCGEAAGLLGDSGPGSGKSVGALALLGPLPKSARIPSGGISLHGRERVGLAARAFREIWAMELAMVLQGPLSSLNPRMTVGQQSAESLRAQLGYGRAKAQAPADELLELVGIAAPERRVNSRPHQLRGGMRQRLLRAIAVSCATGLLIADQPTTTLSRAGMACGFNRPTRDHRAHRRVVKNGRLTPAGMPNAADKEG